MTLQIWRVFAKSQSMPMLAKLLAAHHGFDCTVLFGVNDTGVSDIWGPSDVYRTYKQGEQLPEGCTALVLGQPLIGREPGGPDNPEKEALPIAWIKHWQTSDGKTSRVFHSTMGSGRDFENAGLRRLVCNAAYWCVGLESKISATSRVEYLGEYKPWGSGFDYETLGVIPQLTRAYQ